MLLTLTALRSIDGIHSGCFGHVVKHRPERYMVTLRLSGVEDDVNLNVIYDLMTDLG